MVVESALYLKAALAVDMQALAVIDEVRTRTKNHVRLHASH
jgi:hypothetical protein